MNPKRVGPGLYRDEAGKFWERPFINGKGTWRRLWSKTEKKAREELETKRVDHKRARLGLAIDPYRVNRQVSECIAHYFNAGFPNATGRKRSAKSNEDERKRCELLKAAAGSWRVDHALPATFEHWCRQRDTKRQSDLMAYTLKNVTAYCLRSRFVHADPMVAYKIRFYQASTANHCRDRMPDSADELHALARCLFSRRQSEALGWQLLIEALTGCRTLEILGLRMNAEPQTPGFIDDNWLWIRRSKGGSNPFCEIHPALRECITEHHKWHGGRYPLCSYWVPARSGDNHVTATALTHALRRLWYQSPTVQPHRRVLKKEKPAVTSHGLRAYFVTTRRSQGISDAQIAAEIGDRSGAAIIASTYGAVPPNWQGRAGLGWIPTKGEPAWKSWRSGLST